MSLQNMLENTQSHSSANLEQDWVWFEEKLSPLPDQINNNKQLEYFSLFIQKVSKKKGVGMGCKEILQQFLRNENSSKIY